MTGPVNMARDEALMRCVRVREPPPTLRLYQWDPPTISLGYFQPFVDYEALGPPLNQLAVVRRPTGGGAILHDLELTYSLAIPASHPVVAHAPNRLYELAHEAIIAALNELGLSARRDDRNESSRAQRGPFFCFQRRNRFDVIAGSAKMAGSAQRRTRTAILQHGSIIMADRFVSQRAESSKDESLSLDAVQQEIALLRNSLATQFSRTFGQVFQPGDWSEIELAEAQRLIPKYAGTEWTRRA
jgi:lipoate-protein ligase A